jgi:hypothetical protein
MSNKSARITSLGHYILLLRQEEKRLKWITTSTSATNVENIDATANLRTVSQKLINAERELSDLELGPKR